MSLPRCPNCGREYEIGVAECAGCGILFSKWKPKPSRPAGGGASSSGKSKRLLILLSALSLGLLAVWAAFKPPAGLPVPDGAYQDWRHAFALALPSGWKAQPVEQPGEPYRQVLWASVPDTKLALAVSVGEDRPLGVDESVAGETASLLAAGLPVSLKETSSVRSERVEVDRLKAHRWSGAGAVIADKTDRIDTSDEWSKQFARDRGVEHRPQWHTVRFTERQDRRFIVQFVPGAGRSYLIGVVGEPAEIAAHERELQAAFESFRVLERPLSAWHLLSLLVDEIQDDLYGWLAGLTGLIVLGWAKGLFSGDFLDLFSVSR